MQIKSSGVKLFVIPKWWVWLKSYNTPMTKFAFFDLDGTLYNGLSTLDFYHLMINNGLADNKLLQQNNELQAKYDAGLLSYHQTAKAVVSLAMGLLKDLSRKQILDLEDEFIKVSLKFYPYTRALINLLHQNGFFCYIVSAATFPPVEAIGRELHMPFFASTGVMKDHTYTGEMKLFLNGEAKRKKIHEVLAQAGQPTFSLGFGDSTGDLPLLESADKAFVINPHQEEMKQLSKRRKYILTSPERVIKDTAKVLDNG